MSSKKDFLIVGSGFSGAVFARLAAENGFRCLVIDRRRHVAGNCYSYKDEETGIEIHQYGPHIFHTNSKDVWEFINRFSVFNQYVNRVKAQSGGNVYSFPVNLHTINQFYGKAFSPSEAQAFINKVRCKNIPVNNFEDYILSSLGRELYEAFFLHYTIKQWNIHPSRIPIAVAKRVPIRFNYNDNYYDDSYQGIPIIGYGELVKRILSLKGIDLELSVDFSSLKSDWRQRYRYLVYTGSLDEYFDYLYGALPYRSVIFKEIRGREIQGNAVINYTDALFPFTRIHEHKWFLPERKVDKSIGFEEYAEDSKSSDDQFYPRNDAAANELYRRYQRLAQLEKDVLFLGRLSNYRYYNMDQVIEASIRAFRKVSDTFQKE